ncbi:hypothetical protein PspCFBP13528_17500 [Pseudomonas sp. CFBP13528]|uniref:hypothetical protein n=1 Tax=Pseudomonas sp. CFBP13528 TaxID=2184006 RepID=UPI0010BF672D|nr:hypothetical protein [Pseudomonas sp. CFBP13528]TKK29528.1 hypothetical protein PspCFBP13528_17500 [Pseudomonas sp. CFBP13528]
MSEFKREDRYIIIKRSDLKKVPVAYRSALVDPMFSLLSHLPRREFVVVEHDWPEYHLVWAMIEHRMAGKPVPDFDLWRRADALQALLTAADERADSFDRLYTSSLDERDQLQQRADVLEGLLLQTNELLYAIQGDPGAVPSSSIDSMRGRVFEALKRDRSTSVLHPQNL